MIQLVKLPHEEALKAIEEGEFPKETLHQSEYVAIVLTQSWCPEWKLMNRYLTSIHKSGADSQEDATIYYLIYDGTDYFDQFKGFKEKVLGNALIPYVRFYHRGLLTGESNFLGKYDFLKLLFPE
jgi:hypothetical protein